MEDENIIRIEAKEFYQNHIEYDDDKSSSELIKIFKTRLNDFYKPENKAIFLDEVSNKVIETLLNHRERVHQGKAVETCGYEIVTETLLFYLRQELLTLPSIAHQNFKTNPKQERTNVFISYSHFDKEHLIDVQRHFKPFVNKIDFWDDSKILPGKKWKEEIEKAISKTKVAILLVSTDFLGSEFISTTEIPPLLKAAEENGAVILIVILKPCLFEEFEQLNIYQALNAPNNPISKMNETEKEEFYVNLVRQTKKIIDKNE